ncbi:MAG: hypothetical protein OEZ13_06135 [Spirochaetia bacterium]|nr:hypothetical protein [Spirochaetia bacterium]
MQNQETQGRVLDIQKYHLENKLKDQGIKIKEDKNGKAKVWIRMNQNLPVKTQYTSTCKILFFPKREQT